MPSYPPAPPGDRPPAALGDAASAGWVRRIVDVLNSARQGKLNCTGQVTLTPGTTVTAIVDARIGPFSCIALSPLTANAAGVAWWISAQSNGSATITHPNSAAVDQQFNYAVIG